MRERETELKMFLEHYRREIRQAAGELAEKRLPELTEELFSLYERTGNRLKYEEVYFGRRRFLAVFGMKALLEKRDGGRVCRETLTLLSGILEDICREECWALPAHVNRAESPDWRMTVDLFASETAQTLSALGDMLREELPPATLALIRKNVERRVLEPFFNEPEPYEPWEHVDTNWNAVCAGSIGSACLHLLREEPERLEKCIDRILRALSHYVSGFAEDGTCVEGLSYFTYGMTYFVNFALELKEYTAGEKDILRGEWNGFAPGAGDKRERMARFQQKCFFPDGRTLSFSDGDSRDKFRVGLSCALAGQFDGVLLPNMNRAAGLHDDTCYRFAAIKMDLEETEKYLGTLGKAAGQDATPEGAGFCHILPDAQWCVMGSGNGVGMACKGGYNEEPHNHNDIGHFIYEAAGEFFLTDLGAGEYTRDYFHEGRYGILCNRSLSHSVPIICGGGQCPGKEYRCGAFAAEEDGRVRMELAGAYGEETLESLSRRFAFSKETGVLSVADGFRYMGRSTAAECMENLVTQIKPEVEAGRIYLRGERGSCVISVEEGLAGDILVGEHDHSNHRGVMEKVYTLQWLVPEKDGKAECRFTIRWMPS